MCNFEADLCLFVFLQETYILLTVHIIRVWLYFFIAVQIAQAARPILNSISWANWATIKK